jgi:hypothetical protein
MGVLVEVTPDMGAWSAEVRRESACLRRAFGRLQPRADGRGPLAPQRLRVNRGVGFAIPISEASNVVAALDQIMAHPPYQQWAAEHVPTEGSWRHLRQEDMLHLHGPVIVSSDIGPWRQADSIELAYDHVAALCKLLAAGA